LKEHFMDHKNPVPRILVAVGIAAVSVLVALTLPVGGSLTRPGTAEAGHAECFDYWQHSGHTDVNHIRWWHCHGESQSMGWYFTRVHICGDSGTLHGVTVRHNHNPQGPLWSSDGHDHGDGDNEGC
jgi:hypothetical protein